MREVVKFLIYLFGAVFHHNRKSKVFFYHDITISYTDMGTPLSLFRSHIDIIRKSGFSIVDKIVDSENQIMIAFDDGWKGIYENRLFFVEEKIHPTIFIAVDLIGQDGYLTIDEIKELIALGFVFQAHSWSHTGLPDHHGLDLRHELLDSKNELERLFNVSFDEICFPQGRFSDEVVTECKNANYKLMYSSIPGYYCGAIDKGIVYRHLLQYTPKNQVKHILLGDVPILRRWYFKQHYNSH